MPFVKENQTYRIGEGPDIASSNTLGRVVIDPPNNLVDLMLDGSAVVQSLAAGVFRAAAQDLKTTIQSGGTSRRFEIGLGPDSTNPYIEYIEDDGTGAKSCVLHDGTNSVVYRPWWLIYAGDAVAAEGF